MVPQGSSGNAWLPGKLRDSVWVLLPRVGGVTEGCQAVHRLSLGLRGLMESLVLGFSWDVEQVTLMQFRTIPPKESFAFKVDACMMTEEFFRD